jgi:periplasmic divalent cation tolerance protein
MTERIVVLVTCGSLREGRRIGRALVERKLAACVNVLRAPMESIYRWKGKVDTAKEFLLIIKTTRRRFKAVEEAVKDLHSYDIPEIIALPIEKGPKEYLAWLLESVREERRGKAD